MTGGEKHGRRPIFSLLFLVLLSSVAADFTTNAPKTSPVKFTPSDVYLLDCGAPKSTQLDDGRTFRSDPQSSAFLSTTEDIKLTADPNANRSISPLYLSARVFPESSTYSFFISKPGRHWIRLHFYAFPDRTYNLPSASFTVATDDTVLLRDFSPNSSSPILKEYLVMITDSQASLTFTPKMDSLAFVNAIELVSAPEDLIPDSATGVSNGGEVEGVSKYDLEVTHRINIGGPEIAASNDTLLRRWEPEAGFLTIPETASPVSIPPEKVVYPDDGSVTPLIAPKLVYSTADQMANSNTAEPNFNITWKVIVDPAFSYLVRLHFCDIVSRSSHSFYFNLYLNGLTGASGIDLSSLASGLKTAYYKDFVLNSSTIANRTISVQVGPTVGSNDGYPNAILNGLEVMKMSNSAGSLDGFYSVDGSYHGGSDPASLARKIVSGVGLAMGLTAMALVAVMFCRWRKRPADWEKRNSFSSWLLPLHVNHSTFMSCAKGGSSKSRFGSHKSKSGYSSFFASGALGVGRYFTFAELQEATGNFDEKAILGVGGFGKVYLGELPDSTKLAVKRGNSSSEQGINEFQTEIQMLSKLRHRHLVSLIGCCDENSEMILVYEYMAGGPLRDHLYGTTTLPPLAWKQRLEVCIGAARGLHYLHTGTAQGIIHRDVKTTNILLDEKLVAKVADFGLSKDAPTIEQTHVSTAVKGSFGYLDPEYFRLQQLTEKSDVYSFGVVLFEVLCARPAINPALPREQVNLAEWALQWHRKGQLEKIIDPHLVGTISPASLKKFVEAAEKCLADHGSDRPSMGDVLWNLEYALQLQETSMGEPNDDELVENSAKNIVLEGESAGSHEDSGTAVAINPLLQGR